MERQMLTPRSVWGTALSGEALSIFHLNSVVLDFEHTPMPNLRNTLSRRSMNIASKAALVRILKQ